MKHASRKSYLRKLLDHFGQIKIISLKQESLVKWRRKLYCEQIAQKYFVSIGFIDDMRW